MAVQFAPNDDFLDVVDDLQPVTVTRPGSSTTYDVTHALRRAVTVREAEASAGRYTSGDVAWHLPAVQVPDPPRLGDVIVDGGGGRWTVLAVGQMALDSRWRCVTRDLAAAHGLDDAIEIERAVYTKGTGGAVATTWHTWKTGIRARIQPVAARVRPKQDRLATARQFTIFLEESLPLDHTHRIRGPDGTRYRITACTKPDRIDALMEVTAEKVET